MIRIRRRKNGEIKRMQNGKGQRSVTSPKGRLSLLLPASAQISHRCKEICLRRLKMNIDFNKKDGELTVAIDGRLDTITAPELESFLANNHEGTSALTFDCERLVYISSAGLRVILVAQKTMNKQGKMILKNVAEAVMEVFEMTGLSDLLTIES
jgi:anti-sigma B factor antagonist